MKLWTVQAYHFWEVLQEQGTITTDIRQIDEDWLDGEILDAYQWLASQMELRIGGRPHPDTLPLWAWYQWHGEKRKRPDLRSFEYIPSGQKGVRIEFEIEDYLVLLSDFDLWHSPLNREYLGASDQDTESFYEETEELSHDRLHADPFYRQQIVNSWPRIFDLDWKNENLRIQATFWQLNMKNVRDVTVFISRQKKSLIAIEEAL